jgi:hypothetical protein
VGDLPRHDIPIWEFPSIHLERSERVAIVAGRDDRPKRSCMPPGNGQRIPATLSGWRRWPGRRCLLGHQANFQESAMAFPGMDEFQSNQFCTSGRRNRVKVKPGVSDEMIARTNYALSKQVPNMETGFQIHTDYGVIHVPPKAAAPFAKLAEQMLLSKIYE